MQMHKFWLKVSRTIDLFYHLLTVNFVSFYWCMQFPLHAIHLISRNAHVAVLTAKCAMFSKSKLYHIVKLIFFSATLMEAELPNVVFREEIWFQHLLKIMLRLWKLQSPTTVSSTLHSTTTTLTPMIRFHQGLSPFHELVKHKHQSINVM